MKKSIWLMIGGVCVVAVVVGASSGSLWSGTPVEVAEVEQGLIQEFVDERGMTRLPETYLITMPFPGRIEAITLTEDEPVNEGDEVARIVPLDLDLTVEEATAVVERLEAAIRENAYSEVERTGLDQAKQFVDSMRETVKMADARVQSGEKKHDYQKKHRERMAVLPESTRSQDELDRAVLDEAQAYWDLEQDKFVLAATKSLEAATNLLPTMVAQYIDRKTYTEAVLKKELAEAIAGRRQVEENKRRGSMTSPVTGVVLDRPLTNERFVTAGTTLLEIGRLEDLEVEADVLSVDVVDVPEGAPVRIYGPAVGMRLADGKDYAEGTVTKIYPAGFTKISSLGVEQQRVKVIVRFTPEDLKWLRRECDLGVGYRVRVRIITREEPNALVIPRSALVRGGNGKWNVYAIRGGRARTELVEVGILNDELAQVTSGLAAGDFVVRAPESELENGQRVRVVTEESE
ncbi:MAG: HlyD family efflux transporter periplasmic adaptor subunit [Planctomycetota bacterium]